ncbi:MAG: hypothetical protein KDD35_12425, partial [Bdellovibrionales bacterium]|nr:hypothetical protein [Bdellovibrionales bacterium]
CRCTELALSPQHDRLQLLAKSLRESGFSNSYEQFPVKLEDFEERLQEATQKFQGIRIGSPFGELVTRSFVHEPAMMMSLGSADMLIKASGKWWTRSALFEAFHHLLSQYGDQLDCNASALIVGAGAAARIAVAALVKIGFKQFKVTNQFADQGLSLLAELKGTYFGVQFEFTPVNQLIMLPGLNSIVVNTTPIGPENELVHELLYFNFLASGGEVWDLTLAEKDTPLLMEARQIGTKTVSGFEVASWVDVVWAQRTFRQSLDREAHMKNLISLFQEKPESRS